MSLYENGECGVPYHRGAIFTVELGSLVENGFDLGLDAYPILTIIIASRLMRRLWSIIIFGRLG